MSWGTDFNTDIFIRNKQFANECQLNEAIEEVKTNISEDEKSMAMYFAANPKDVVSEEWKDDKIAYLQFELNELLESYSTNIRLLYILELYKESNPFE